EKDWSARGESTTEPIASRRSARAGMDHHGAGDACSHAFADCSAQPITGGSYPPIGGFRSGGTFASRGPESSPSSPGQGQSGAEMVAGGPGLMSAEVTGAVYWDSSAVLSALFATDIAMRRASGLAVQRSTFSLR